MSFFDIFNSPKASGIPTTQGDKPELANLLNEMDQIYKVEAQNWYSAKPYGFKMTTRDGKSFVMFLPINPSNLKIQTPFATNLIPTLYGTVEEHSDIRYYRIIIEGTTGIAPKFVSPGAGEEAATLYRDLKKSGRSSASVAFNLSAGGLFAKTLGTINQIKNKAVDLLGSHSTKTGVAAENSGYAAFHNLYRFLKQHKKDAAGVDGSSGKRKSHPLTFFNYKDNNQYDVVVRDFSLMRSADNPMLYHYSISLTGFNLRGISAPIDENLSQRLEELGLNGINGSSLLGDIKSISSSAKAIIGSAVGGISVLGR